MKGRTINVGGVGDLSTEELKINYVQATPSAASMEVVLTDAAGIPFFHAKCGTVVESKELPMNGQEINGLKCGVFANCSRIIIGVERVLA